MQRRTIILLVLIVGISMTTVVSLLLITNYTRQQPNGFSRVFLNHAASPWRTIPLQYPNFYMAGATHDRTYLANTTAYGLLFTCTHSSLDTGYLYLQMPEQIKLQTAHIRIFVDSPDIVLLDAVSPQMLKGTLDTKQLKRTDPLPSGFYEALPMSSNRVAATIYDTTRRQTDLTVLEAGNKEFVPAKVLTKKIDGRFCTSGRLFRDNENGQMVYIYFYRNQYILLDSLLHITQLGKTVDTITQSPLILGTINNGRSTTFAKPPQLVNRWAALSSGKLYVLSNIQADNEKWSDFKNNGVFDVYDIKRHRYDYSFHLPKVNDKPIQQFVVRGKYLVALTSELLMVTTLNIY